MLSFLKRHSVALAMTLIAFVIVYMEFKATQISVRWYSNAAANPFFVAMGKWGIRFLLISLAVTPLYTLTGWRSLNKIRKPAGLAAVFFVAIHAGMHVFYRDPYLSSIGSERTLISLLSEPWYILLGTAAFVILALLTLTSIKPTMKLMGRYWKPLHRLVYVAGILVMLHSMIVASSGKRAFLGGSQSLAELKIYTGILVLLLVARIPIVRDFIKDVSPFMEGRKSKQKRAPIAMETGE